MIMPTVKTRIFALGCLFALASAPVVQTVAQNGQYIYDVQDGEADIFGQLRYEKNVNGTGLVKLNTANPNGYQWVRDYGYQAGVTPITTAGTYVGSEYYAYETTLYANTLMPRAISVVDVNTGEYTAKREIVNSTTEAPLILDEMTYDPKTNRIFGLHYDTSANKSYIYEIDRKTLDIALVATIDKVLFYTLAADNGSLYAVRKGGMKSYLSKIDISSINKTTKTCEYKDLGNTNVYLGDYSQTMEFDKTTHRLWWMAQTSDGNAYLVELNPQTGAQIKKEFIDNEMQLLGMGIPYQYVADGAPSYPRAFKATADAKGALSAQLSWTTPSVNYLGAKLSALTGTKVYRNDQLVYTSTETTQGKSVAWTDRPSTDGYYIYKVVPYNAAGDGVYKEFAAYVGEDLPGAPQLRDAVHQDAAWLSLSLEDGDVESLASQVASHRQARRTRTDDCHTSTCLLRQFLAREFHLGIEVSNKLFQLTYLHRLTLLAEHAMSLALFLVRTNSSADGRQVALGIDDGHRRTHVAHGQLVHEVWNIILDRTSLAALRNLAMQATLGFFYRLLGRETFVDNLEASHWLRLLRCTLLSI